MKKNSLVNKITNTELVHDCLTKKGLIYTYLNPVSYLTALNEKALFDQMDGIFADGGLLVKAIKLLYGVKVTRRSFDMTSMAPEVLTYAGENSMSVCVVATKQEMLNRTIDIFAKQYPNIVWKDCRNGFFLSENEMLEVAKNIANDNPDFLIVGMGALLQEKFLLMCKNAGYQGIGFTCGGFIHQTALLDDKVDYYPEWVDKYNIRFMYRMIKEPYTIKRYAIAAFVFPWVFMKERFFG